MKSILHAQAKQMCAPHNDITIRLGDVDKWTVLSSLPHIYVRHYFNNTGHNYMRLKLRPCKQVLHPSVLPFLFRPRSLQRRYPGHVSVNAVMCCTSVPQLYTNAMHA